MARTEQTSRVDAELRVLETVLEPALALARVLMLSMDDVVELVSIGYYRELKRRGASWEQIARRLKKSRRTVAALAKRDRVLPLDTSRRITLRRAIIARVARDRSTADALVEALADPSARAELELLIGSGILERDASGELSVAPPLVDLVGDALDERIDSLRHFLHAIGSVVFQRFFARDRAPEAFARVLTFRTTRERLQAMEREIYDIVARTVVEADAEAGDDSVQASVALAFVEQPSDPPWRE